MDTKQEKEERILPVDKAREITLEAIKRNSHQRVSDFLNRVSNDIRNMAHEGVYVLAFANNELTASEHLEAAIALKAAKYQGSRTASSGPARTSVRTCETSFR